MNKREQSVALMTENQVLYEQNAEKEQRATKLAVANKKLAFQNKEKEKRTAQLVIENKELLFQNRESEKRAAELVIANEELLFQNKESEKRAAELVIINEELLFQNQEKEKRATELVIANKDLASQNTKKDKQTKELSLAHSDLIKVQERIIYGNRLYSFISHINKAIVYVKNAQQVYEKACQIAIEFGKFKAGWIGLIDEECCEISLVEGCGISAKDQSVLKKVRYKENGPQNYVLENNSFYVCNNIQCDFELESWKLFASKNQFNAMIVLPIRKADTIIGTFNLYAEEIDFFTAGEIELLTEATKDISFALDVFEKDELRAQAESNLQAIFEGTSEGFILVDTNGIVKAFNIITAKTVFLNTKKAINIGDNVYDFIHLSHKEFYKNVKAKVLKGTKVQFDYYFERKNGIIKWFSFTVNPVYDSSGKIEGICITSADITKRKKAENEIADYKFALNQSSIVAITDKYGLIKFVNENFCNISQYSAAELLGKDHHMMNSSHHPHTFFQHLWKTIASGHLWQGEIKNRAKDGSFYWLDTTIVPFLDNEGIPYQYMAIRFDITERKTAEDKLQISEAFSKGVLSSLHSHIAVIDQTGTLIAVNKAWNNFATENDVASLDRVSIGSNYFDVCKQSIKNGDNNAAQALQGLHSVLKKEQQHFEMEYPCHSPKEKRWFMLSTWPFGDEADKVVVAHIDITERKNAELKLITALHELKEERTRLLTAQAVAKVGSWETDLQSLKVNWSEETHRLYGTDAAHFDPSYSAIQSFIHPEDKQMVDNVFKSSIHKSGSHAIKHRIISWGGIEKWIEENWTITKDINGLPLRAIGTCQDITEKQKLEELLDKTNRLAAIGSWEIDVDTKTIFWSDIAKEIRETAPDYVPDLTTGIGFFTEGINKEIISQRVQQCIDKGISWDEELQMTTFKGNLKWVRTIGEGEFINGVCKRIYGSFQDITVRKNTEHLLQQSQANLKAIIENTDAIIYSLDTEFRYIAFNSLLFNYLKKTHGLEVHIGDLATRFLDNLNADEAINWKTSHTKALQGETVKFEKELNVGERHTWSSFSINPIWENKTVVGLSCFVYDITVQKQEQQQKEKMSADLMQRNRNLEQFTFIISHNLRAPAANIIGCTENLQDESNTLEEQKILLHALSDSATALDAVIKDINTVLQLKSDFSEKKEIILFSTILSNITISIGNLINKHQVRIVSDFSQVDKMYSLKIYIYSIFYNLISNSIKYGKPNQAPQIEIKSKKEKGKIILTFKDNGLGIDMKTKSTKVFGLYSRFHSHIEGKGIGLFMVKTQVEALGGTISVKSKLNEGAEFTIVFEI